MTGALTLDPEADPPAAVGMQAKSSAILALKSLTSFSFCLYKSGAGKIRKNKQNAVMVKMVMKRIILGCIHLLNTYKYCDNTH